MSCESAASCDSSKSHAETLAGISLLQRDEEPIDRTALIVQNLGKRYRRYARQWDRIRQWFARNPRQYYQEHWALRGVSLRVERGQTVGILGANGSGKSTLLQLIAGTLTPSEGSVRYQGRVAALLELGSGFHPDFTGWENASLQAGILGLSPAEIEERLPIIAEFSELGEALNHPLRTYSSGMIVRLGFSVAISVDPDLLLIDEALAVGDMRFQHKCMTRIRHLRKMGITILLVTHDLSAIKRLCDHAYVLHQGRMVQSGPADPVCNWYFGEMTSAPPTRADLNSKQLLRHGQGGAKIQSWQFLDEYQKPISRAWLGKIYTLRVLVHFQSDVEKPVLGFYLRDHLGTEVLGTNTDSAAQHWPPARAGDTVVVTFRFALRIRPGAYTLCMAIVNDPISAQCLDWIDNADVLEVLDPQSGRVIHGLIAEDIAVKVTQTAVQQDAA
jgi:ABC-type polysaccharide/polyol phosphate transport system ATPase subunit